ncbi:MAG: hypothetical protein K9G62_04010 [Alphaproteobacteria bacterium]|nr:hypothetical protein [Alphaproteobacteria bacterium]
MASTEILYMNEWSEGEGKTISTLSPKMMEYFAKGRFDAAALDAIGSSKPDWENLEPQKVQGFLSSFYKESAQVTLQALVKKTRSTIKEPLLLFAFERHPL